MTEIIKIDETMIAAILGSAPYMKRESVVRRLVREYHGADSEFDGNVAIDWATTNEPGAIMEFTLETGLTVERLGPIERDYLLAKNVMVCSNGALFYIRCPFGLRNKPSPVFMSAEKQRHHYDRIQHLLAMTDLDSCYYYQWAPNGTKLEVVKQDIGWSIDAGNELKAFIQELKTELNCPSHLEPLRVVIDTDEAVRLVNELGELDDAINNAKARQSEIMDALVVLADGKDAVIAGRNLTKMERKGSISYAKAIKDLMPNEDLEQYRGKDSTHWRLF